MSRAGRSTLAATTVCALLGQALAEPTDVLRQSNPGVSASASSYGTPQAGHGEVVEQSGTFTYSYPISVPPGRLGMQPSLTLTYSSAAPFVGDVAAGWSFNLPEISQEDGLASTETPGEPTTWRSTLGGGSLIPFPDPNSGTMPSYRAWGDSSFTRYRRTDPEHWEAQSPDGTVHRFVRLAGRAAPNERFVLESTTDKFGNAVRYSWARNLSPHGIPTDLLASIEYTYNDNLDVGPFARIVFEYGDMELCGTARVPIGALLEVVNPKGDLQLRGAHPLSRIRTEVRDTPDSAYRPIREIALGYDGNDCGGPSHSPVRLLSSVQESARSVGGAWKTTPPTSFEYGDIDQMPLALRRQGLGGGQLKYNTDALTWGHSATPVLGGAGSRDWSDTYGLLADIDGDGSQDRLVADVKVSPNNDVVRPLTCEAKVYRNVRGTGFASIPTTMQLPGLWKARYCSLSVQPAVPTLYNAPPGAPTVSNGETSPINTFKLVDLNSDGLADIVSAILLPRLPGNSPELPAHPNCDAAIPNPDWVVCNGPGTDTPAPAPVPVGARFPQKYDGRYVWRWYRNLGNGQFSSDPTFVAAPIPLEVIGDIALPNDDIHEVQTGLYDIDGDGHLDAVWTNPDGAEWHVWLGDGTGSFQPQPNGAPYAWTAPSLVPPGVGANEALRATYTQSNGAVATTYLIVGLLDVNRDGRVDVLAEDPDPRTDRLVAYLNTGRGFSSIPEPIRASSKSSENLDMVAPANYPRLRIFRRRVADFNGDGTLDLLSFTPSSNGWQTGAGMATVQYGVGTSLADGPQETFPVAEQFGSGLFARGIEWGLWYMVGDLTDFDGDGYADVVGMNWQFGYDPAQSPPGLLRKVHTGRDASTTIAYAPRTDTNVVSCSLGDCSALSTMPRWVVRDTTLWSAGRSGPAIHSFAYRDPIARSDEHGRRAFRGFRRVQRRGASTGTGRAETITDFEYDRDYRGLPTMQRTVDDVGRLHAVSSRGWTTKSLHQGYLVPVFLPEGDRAWTCKVRPGALEPQTNACMAQDVSVETVRTWAPLPAAGPIASAWVEVETSIAEAVGASRGKHRGTRITHTLVATDTDYLVLLNDESTYEAVAGQEYLRSRKLIEYEPGDLGIPRRLKTWIQGEEYAVGAVHVAPTTGLVMWEQKPDQYRRAPDAPDGERARTVYTYDVFASYVESVENELGQRVSTTRDRGTGVVIETAGPNTWQTPGCGVCSPTPQRSKVEIDGFGRVEKTWVTDLDPVAGYQLRLASTVTFIEPPGSWITVETAKFAGHSESSNAVRDRIEVDATGLVMSQLTLGQPGGSDIPSSFVYTPIGSLQIARIPDPSDDVGTVQHRWEYDAIGRETQSVRPDGSGTSTSYNELVVTTNELGTGSDPGALATSHYHRDVFGNLVAVVEAAADADTGLATATYSYDALGRMTTIVDADGFATSMSYDGAGRRLTVTRAGRTWRYGYDHNGNQRTWVAPHPAAADPLAYTTSIVYDDLDRPISRIQGARDLTAAELATFGDGTAHWEYDAAPNGVGRVAAAVIATGADTVLRRSFEYDARGNTTLEQVTFSVWGGAFGDTRTVRRGYDAQNRLTFVEYADGTATSQPTRVAYHTDARGLPREVRWVNRPGSGSATNTKTAAQVDPQRIALLTHNRAGRPIRRDAPHLNHRETWAYDQLGRSTQHTVQARSAVGAWFTVASHSMSYFAADDLRTLNIYATAGDGERTEQWIFDYDNRHQLTAASNGGEEVVVDYTMGGRIHSVYADYEGTEHDHDYTYSYGGAGDPEVVDHVVDSLGGEVIELDWDDAGNLLGRSGWFTSEYRYDGADDLREARTGIASAATREVYWYEANGQRVLALTTDLAGDPTGMKLWFGETEVHYGPNGAATDTIAHVALGRPVARIRNAHELEHTFHSQRHDLIASIDDAANPTAAFTYTPWGESTRSLGADAVAQRRRFNGKESDLASGLSYYGFRYYDPALRIWTQADPYYRYAPDRAWSEPRRANLYTFSANNPIRFYDPDGRDTDAMAWHRYEVAQERRNDPALFQVDWDIAGRTLDATVGFLEIKAGAALCTTGLGCAVGAALAADGADRINSALTGSDRVIPGLVRSGASAVGLDPEVSVGAYEGAVAALTMSGPGTGAAAGGNAAREVLTVKNVWALPHFERGRLIEQLLGTTLPYAFPVIDRFVNGVATSIKSLDLAAKSYRHGSRIRSTLKKYIDELASFNGATHGGARVARGAITARRLEVAIPIGPMSAEQLSAIEAMIQYGAAHGVEVVVRPM